MMSVFHDLLSSPACRTKKRAFGAVGTWESSGTTLKLKKFACCLGAKLLDLTFEYHGAVSWWWTWCFSVLSMKLELFFSFQFFFFAWGPISCVCFDDPTTYILHKSLWYVMPSVDSCCLVSACYMAIVFKSLGDSNFSHHCKGQWTGTCGMRSLQLRYSPWQGSPAPEVPTQDDPLGRPMQPMLAIMDVPPQEPDAAHEGEADVSGKWHLEGYGEPADWGFENVFWFWCRKKLRNLTGRGI